jgi:hypothetical protein
MVHDGIRPKNNVHQFPGRVPKTPPQPPDGGGDSPMIGERLAKVEGACEGLRDSIEGLRHGQNLLMGLVGVGFAVIIAIVGYAISRIDNLPADFERTNQTISQAITAAKQQPAQVILLPAPTQPPQEAPKKKP